MTLSPHLLVLCLNPFPVHQTCPWDALGMETSCVRPKLGQSIPARSFLLVECKHSASYQALGLL